MRFSILLAALLVVPLADTAAQDLLPQPGQRVRVTVPTVDVSKEQATFQRVAGDTLVLSSASYALADVTRLDVFAGRHGHPWNGMLVGFLGGAVAGAGIAVAATDPEDEFYGLVVLVGAGIGAGGGLLIGTAVGASIKTDKWEQVPLDRLQVRPVATRNGHLGLAVSLSF
jgi:hypothetical protein